MKKAKRSIVVIIMVACMLATLVLSGCSEKVEVLGYYHFNQSSASQIQQGAMFRTYADTLVVKSDNTFTAICVIDSYYSSDGASYNPTFYLAHTMYGTYEVVSEDKELNEKTIKITDVTGFMRNDEEGLIEKASFSAELTEAVNSALIGKELILTSDYKLGTMVNDTGVASKLPKTE